MDDERLIVEVEQHKLIYDTINPFYKDNVRKDKAWHLISVALGVDADLCKARWKTLRDAFVKNRKKSGLAGGTQREWKYAEIMSFLVPYIQPKSSKSNLSQSQTDEERLGTPQSESEDRSAVLGIPFQPPSPSMAPLNSPPSSPRSRSPRDRTSAPAAAAQARLETRRGQRSNTDIGERLMSFLEQPLPKPQMPDGELDEAYHFAMSIVPMLHRLHKDSRQQAKIEILSMLHNLERAQAEQDTIQQQQQQQQQFCEQPPLTPSPALGRTAPVSPPTHFRPINPTHTQTGLF